MSSGFLQGSARVVGLAGAYTAVAEGGDGLVSNIAAAAHRPRTATGRFSFDPLFGLGVVPATDRQDLDNDGAPDEGEGTYLVAFGARLQVWRIGLAYHARALGPAYCLERGTELQQCPRSIEVAGTYSVLGGAVTLFRDQLVVGAGWLRASGGVLTYDGSPNVGDEKGRASAEGSGLELGVLVRPEGQRFRVGASFRSAVSAPMGLDRGASADDFFGRAVYSGIAMPATLSLGVSAKLLEGAEAYNALSPAAQKDYGDTEAEVAPLPEERTGRLLVSGQLDFALPVARATGAAAFLLDRPSDAVGAHLTVAPRLAVEHLTVVRRLRLRGGGYLEPSVFESGHARPHATAGFALRLGELVFDWALEGYADVAPRFQNYGVSLGTW